MQSNWSEFGDCIKWAMLLVAAPAYAVLWIMFGDRWAAFATAGSLMLAGTLFVPALITFIITRGARRARSSHPLP